VKTSISNPDVLRDRLQNLRPIEMDHVTGVGDANRGRAEAADPAGQLADVECGGQERIPP
jgi:hypothetical protein